MRIKEKLQHIIKDSLKELNIDRKINEIIITVPKDKNNGDYSTNIALTLTKEFFKSFGQSWKQLWKGNPANSGFRKYAGKSLILASILTTLGLTTNVISRAHKMAKDTNLKTIDKTKESTVI